MIESCSINLSALKCKPCVSEDQSGGGSVQEAAASLLFRMHHQIGLFSLPLAFVLVSCMRNGLETGVGPLRLLQDSCLLTVSVSLMRLFLLLPGRHVVLWLSA